MGTTVPQPSHSWSPGSCVCGEFSDRLWVDSAIRYDLLALTTVIMARRQLSSRAVRFVRQINTGS